MLRIKGQITISVAVCVLLLGIGGGSYALAQSNTQDSNSGSKGTSSDSAKAKHGSHKDKKGQKGERRIRGQALIKSKSKKSSDGLATVSFDRGELTSVGNGQIALKDADGPNQTFNLDSHTKVKVDDQQSSPSDLKAGMQVVIHTRQPTGQSAKVNKVNVESGTSSSSGS